MPKNLFKKMSPTMRYATVMGISVIFALAACLIAAAIASKSDDPAKNLTLYGEICFGLTAFVCGFVGAKLGEENRFASGLLASTLLIIIITVISIFIGGSQFSKKALLFTLGIIMSAIGAVIGAKEKKRKRKKR